MASKTSSEIGSGILSYDRYRLLFGNGYAEPPLRNWIRASFRIPFTIAKGERRAQVALKSLDTLWFNTGTLCNLTCQHCYIESRPKMTGWST